MSTVAQHIRSGLRWLLTPLLLVIDRRIAWRSQRFDDRLVHAERDLDALKTYTQLLAGALPSTQADRPKPSDGSEPATPEAEGEATAVTPSPVDDEGVGFIERFCCPVCRAAVRVVPEIVTSDGRIKRGYIPCAGCGEVIAKVRDFRADFRARGGTFPTHAPPPRVIPVLGEIRIRFDDPRLLLIGDWTVWDKRFVVSHGPITDSLEYKGKFIDALVHLVTHVNGGIVDFFVDGKHTATADLYSDHWFVLPFAIVSDLPFEEHVLRIQPRGTKTAAATGSDIMVAELVLSGPRTDLSFQEPRPMNRGNPYIDVFERCISQVPEGELILEVGGGERRRLRPGYVNLEYMTVECADVYGDIQCVPFQDDTFSLVLTQAVFEHLPNPFAAAAELIRVAKPGGLIVTDVAFMQPLHAAPYHYFNMTPWGIEELFKACSIIESDHYDGVASTVEWLLKSVGAQATVTDEDFSDIIQRIRAMEAKLSHADIRPAASGVWVVARKPA